MRLFNRISTVFAESRLLINCVLGATEPGVAVAERESYMRTARKVATRLREVMDGD